MPGIFAKDSPEAHAARGVRQAERACLICGTDPCGSRTGYCRDCGAWRSALGGIPWPELRALYNAGHRPGGGRAYERVAPSVRPRTPQRVEGAPRKRRASTTTGYESDQRVKREVLRRAGGASELDGTVPTWTRDGMPSLTVHHPWPEVDGTAYAIAITYEQHAEVSYGDGKHALDERMKQRLREIEPDGGQV